MHRNTKTLTVILLITAALLLGVRISNLLSGTPEPSASPSPPGRAPAQFPATPTKTYINSNCGITLEYPADFTSQESTNAARLTKTGTTDTIDIACGKNLPKPPLPKEKVETATVAGQLATIYHDKLAKDGSLIDVVMLTHPKTKLEIALFGWGEVFTTLLKSIRFIQ